MMGSGYQLTSWDRKCGTDVFSAVFLGLTEATEAMLLSTWSTESV
jgi:hypothetical protein